jgi:eukaryotic-like serine/threonine-protein kinase
VNTGAVIDSRYRLRGLLGRGAMAEVHVATDLRLGRTVAVKIARSEPGACLERNRHEMQTLASLNHPHVVRLLDAGQWDGIDYLVLEHVNGPSLALRLREGTLPVGEVSRLGGEAASALAYLHERGIVHRDVKPANILLDRGGHAHVADFGTAWHRDSARLTATGQTIGTASYLSPEQVRGNGIGPPTDVYALGLVLLECLTGRREYVGTPAEAALARLSRPPVIDDDLPESWARRLAKMTALDAADRPGASTVAEWFGIHEQAATQVIATAAAAAPPDPPVADPAAQTLPTTLAAATPLDESPDARPPARLWLRAGAGIATAAAAIAVAGIVSAASNGGSAHHNAPTQSTANSGTVNSHSVNATTSPTTPLPTQTAAPAPAAPPPAPAHKQPHGHHHGGG